MHIGVLSVVIFIAVYLLFKKKVFGLLDPLSWFIFARVAPMLCVCILIFDYSDNPYWSILFIISAILFSINDNPAITSILYIIFFSNILLFSHLSYKNDIKRQHNVQS